MERNLEDFKQALEYANALLEPEFTVASLRETEHALSEASREFEASIIEDISEYSSKNKVKALRNYLDELEILESRTGYLQKEIPWWAAKLYAPEGSSSEMEGEKELAGYLPQLVPEIPALLAGLARCCEGQISERNRAFWRKVVEITVSGYGRLGVVNAATIGVAEAASTPLPLPLYSQCINEIMHKNFSQVVVKLGGLVSEHSANGQNSQFMPYAKWFDPLTKLCQSITETGGFTACDNALQEFAGQIREVAHVRRADVKTDTVGRDTRPAAAPALAGELPVLQWNKSVADLAELLYRLARAGFIDVAAHRDRSRDPESNLLGLCRHVCQLFQVAPAHREGAAKNLNAYLSKFKPEQLVPGPFDAAALSTAIGRKPNNAKTLHLGAMMEGLGVSGESKAVPRSVYTFRLLL